MNVTATLFGQMLTFAVLVWFVMQFLWDPILRMLEDRKKRIADGLAAAEQGHHKKELGEARAKEVLQDAKRQASEIIAQARKRGDEIIEEAKSSARGEGERLIVAARAEIEHQSNQAKEQLRGEVSKLALACAEQVLLREVDEAAHNELLDKLVARL